MSRIRAAVLLLDTRRRLFPESRLGYDCALPGRLPYACTWPGCSCDEMEMRIGNGGQQNKDDSRTSVLWWCVSTRADDNSLNLDSATIALI